MPAELPPGAELPADEAERQRAEAQARLAAIVESSDDDRQQGPGRRGHVLEQGRRVAVRHGIKGIALSGFGQEEDIRRSRDAGFETHLTKPVNIKVLHEMIRSVAG